MTDETTEPTVDLPVVGRVSPSGRWSGPTRVAARLGVAVSFWLAVALPLALLGLLAGGIDRPSDALVFLTLVATNGAALVVGRGYAAPGDAER